MSTRIKPVGLLALLALAVVALSQLAPGVEETSATKADVKKKVKFVEEVRQVQIETSPDYPAAGSTAVWAGVIDLTPGGPGAKRLNVTITDFPSQTSSSPTSFDFRGKVTDYVAKGSIRMTFTGTAELLADGSETLTGTAKITGGTGRFKGARGKLKAEGTAPELGGVITGTGTGTLIY